MNIKVNEKNEIKFTPDVYDNLSQPVEQRFTVVLRRLNPTLHADRWINWENQEGAEKQMRMRVDVGAKLRAHVVRFINAPILEIEKERREMTIDDLLSDKYPELDLIIEQIVNEISRITLEPAPVETKKK